MSGEILLPKNIKIHCHTGGRRYYEPFNIFMSELSSEQRVEHDVIEMPVEIFNCKVGLTNTTPKVDASGKSCDSFKPRG